jgi:hypothetical protein
MQAAFEENSIGGERPEAYWAVVADLVSLIQRTRDLAHATAAATPASAIIASRALAPDAIGDCNRRLREALHVLLEARASAKRQARKPQL